ncbi:MAG: transposase [Planctomycetaceae bacterium]
MKKKSQPIRATIPQDLNACQALIQELFATIAQQQESLVEKDRQLVEKQARIEQLVQERFRRRSERYKPAPNQMVLDFPGVPGIECMAEALADAVVEEVEAEEVAVATKTRKPRQRRQERLPEDLPRREIVVERQVEPPFLTRHHRRSRRSAGCAAASFDPGKPRRKTPPPRRLCSSVGPTKSAMEFAGCPLPAGLAAGANNSSEPLWRLGAWRHSLLRGLKV